MPLTPHVRGASAWLTRDLEDRSARPMRRVVLHSAPTAGSPGWSRWRSTTPFCHSWNRVGSVALAKTCDAGRSTSTAATMPAISATQPKERRIAGQDLRGNPRMSIDIRDQEKLIFAVKVRSQGKRHDHQDR